jgi:hydrogenase-4 component H
MSLRSKFEEALLCLKAGRVTLPYPAQPQPAPEQFRGRPIFDVSQEIRVLQYLGRRCTYCGRCAEVCPEKAITMSREFENATSKIGDLGQRLKLFMSTCQRCGRCFKPPSALEELKMKGYRFDDLEHERWIFRSQSRLEGDPVVDDVEIELD